MTNIPVRILVAALLTQLVVAAENPGTAPASSAMKWITFPDARLELRGLPWFAENAPELWRLPRNAKAHVPAGVWNRAVAPDGGRIRFSSTTSQVTLRVEVVRSTKRTVYFDAYIGDTLAGSGSVNGVRRGEIRLFAERGPAPKAITIYLPNTAEVRIEAVGVDQDATLEPPPRFAHELPLVCYGSSVLQGTGADHPAKTYPAVLARKLNLDFVNLGFGGAGKAEPAVVALVNQLNACCYLFDLGKSYGNQTKEPFVEMLAAIRARHPTVPMVCVTPTYSTKEPNEPEYRERSERLRDMMRAAALDRRAAGDVLAFVVEGLDLFGPADKALFHDPQHPNDEGNERMAERLAPFMRKQIFNGKPAATETR